MLFIILRGNPEIVLIVFGVVGVIALAGYYFSRQMVVRRALRAHQQKRISDFLDGDNGKIIGKAVFAGETLYAPLSGRQCSWYHVRVQEYRSSGKSGHWHTVFEESKKGDVVISDGSGYAIVDTRNTKTYLVSDVQYKSGSFNDPTPELENFLKQRNLQSTSWLGFNKSIRYEEGVLENGEMFAVSGQCYWNTAAGHKLKIPSPKVLVVTVGDHEKTVFVSDDPVAVEENRA
jgi:hypothetical protein